LTGWVNIFHDKQDFGHIITKYNQKELMASQDGNEYFSRGEKPICPGGSFGFEVKEGWVAYGQTKKGPKTDE